MPQLSSAPDEDFVAVQQALAGQYSLERELGRGGMGIVYLAREVELERLVAIKVLPPAIGERHGLRERFMREARTAARLSHPHIVPIHRVGEAGPFVYFAMAYVDGETLGQRLRARGVIPPDELTRVLRETAWALAYAHAQGVVHRDVKPDNILLERETGRVLVSDFGIAQIAEAGSVTDPQMIMGTAHYMSPEQAAGEPLDGRSDLYALGVIGYLALTGQFPIDGPTPAVVLARQITEAPAALAPRATHAPPGLVGAVERCLSKDRDARFGSGEALADALVQSVARRTELPLPLRAWAEASDPARPFYGAWSAMFGFAFVMELFGDRQLQLDLLGWGALPIVPVVAFELRQMVRLVSQGYGLADVRLALAERRKRRREEIAQTLDERPHRWIGAMRLIGWTGLAALFASATLFDGREVMALFPDLSPRLMGMLIGTSIFGSVGSLLLANALGAPPLGRSLKLRLAGRARQWLYGSRVGEWTMKLVRSARRGNPVELVARPTEMALGLAAADLFAALPRELKSQLSEVPAVVHRLEERAVEARRRVDELQALHREAESEAAHAAAAKGASADDSLMARRSETVRQLTAARDVARDELARTVAALERIRLDLLRLAAGSARPVDATTMLDAAQRAVEEIELVASAQREVNELALPSRVPSAPDPLASTPA